MNIDPAVLASIEKLVEHDPSNLPLRLHLAGLLLDADQAPEAQSHIAVVLAAEPAHESALALAARAADAMGDAARAAAYRRLSGGLGPAPSATDAEPPPQMPPVTSAARPERVSLRLVEGNRPVDAEPDEEPAQPVVTLQDSPGWNR